jgi:hypothetical protein
VFCIRSAAGNRKQKAKVTLLYVLEDGQYVSSVYGIVFQVMTYSLVIGHQCFGCMCFLHFHCMRTFTTKCGYPQTRLYRVVTKKTAVWIFAAMKIPNCKLHKQWMAQKGHALARHLVDSILLWRPGFSPSSVHVGYVEDELALGQVFSVSTWVLCCRYYFCEHLGFVVLLLFLWALGFCAVVISPLLHTQVRLSPVPYNLNNWQCL